MKRIFTKALLGASAAALAATPAFAQDAPDNVSVTVAVDYVTEYVFRGTTLAESAVQPSVEVGLGDFYVGGWFSTAIGETSVFAGDEFDLYAGYGFELSDVISADVGLTYYHYPQGPGGFLDSDSGGADGTYEVYGGLALDTVASPSVYAYYDLDLDAFTLEGGLGHSIELAERTGLDLGLTAGLVDGDGFSYEYGSASAGVSYAFTDAVSTYASANYALSSEDSFFDGRVDFDTGEIDVDQSDDTFWLAVGISAGF